MCVEIGRKPQRLIKFFYGFVSFLEQQGWWFSKNDDTYMAQDYTDCCKGYKESLEVIKKTMMEQVV